MRNKALRAYELGRLRTSIVRALFVVAPVAALAVVVGGAAWLPITVLAWIFANWRGGPLLRGSYIGLIGGTMVFVLSPVSSSDRTFWPFGRAAPSKA